MLTKRQQAVLRAVSSRYAFKDCDGQWLLMSDEDDYVTSSSTLYRLIDAELAALGIVADGDAVVEATERGEELAGLLAASLTKRQQAVLKALLDFETSGDVGYAFPSAVRKGLWNFSNIDFCSASTVYTLVNAELIGLGVGVGMVSDRTDAALTPRGRRLAELLP